MIDVVVGVFHTKFVFEVEAFAYADINVERLWELHRSDGEVVDARQRPSILVVGSSSGDAQIGKYRAEPPRS